MTAERDSMTLQEMGAPALGVEEPRPTPARALRASERAHVLDVLASPRFVDRSPAEVVVTLLDEGRYLCAERTMYRILAANQPVRERRNQRSHPCYTKMRNRRPLPARPSQRVRQDCRLRAWSRILYPILGQTLCRDCGRRPPPDAGTCPACGSARVLRHAELHDLAIAHLDCDAFYAAIEKRERPELRDLPVIVGGRHRTVRSKGCLSNKTALAMVFKLAQAAQNSWRRLDGHNQLPKLIVGVKFIDGIEAVRQQPQAAA